ncbi:MAG: hypothetical protein IIV29_03685 [Tidjanibacter sp.]|nr:hypothetical protein [Tidjanibacter sp.]
MIGRLALVAFAVVACGCSAGESGEVERISIRELKSLYRGYPVRITEQVVVEGVVVGTDRYGELYHQLMLQDHTGGVVFSINDARLYETYSVGDSLRVGCCGLTLGGYGHSVRVGDAPQGDGYQTSPIDWTLWCSLVEHCGVGHKPKAERVEIGAIGPQHISTIVRVDDVRFVEAGESVADKGVAVSRHLVSAIEEEPTDTLVVRASGRSDFYDMLLPAGPCSVVGIAGYFHDDYQLLVDSPDRVLAGEEYH